MVAEIINLNKFRKTHKREQKRRQSVKNRVKFGQTKMEKVHKEYKSQREDKELSGKQLNNDGPDVA